MAESQKCPKFFSITSLTQKNKKIKNYSKEKLQQDTKTGKKIHKYEKFPFSKHNFQKKYVITEILNK